MKKKLSIFIAVFFLVLLTVALAEARIIRIEITRMESPTFEGTIFGDVGQYEKIVGKAYGEVKPDDPKNAIITDIDLAARNARGMVEYVSDFYLLKPVDMSKGSGILFYALPNRGRKLTFGFLHHGSPTNFGGNDPSTAADAGDGFLMKRGYTILWGGVQGDLFPGEDRVTLQVPIAKNPDGSEITGRMRAEYGLTAPTNTLYLSSSPYTGQTLAKTTHTPYETISTDNCTAILTKRVHESDSRIPVWNNEWAFADCSTVMFPGVPDTKKICLKDGFDPNYIYELIYTAKNPKVLGLGFAACRDLTSFFRNAERDDAATPNPLAKGIRKAILQGISKVGNFVRTFTDLGFNQDENDQMVFDGMSDVIGPRRISLNVRFGRPGGAGMQHEDHLFPGNQSPSPGNTATTLWLT